MSRDKMVVDKTRPGGAAGSRSIPGVSAEEDRDSHKRIHKGSDAIQRWLRQREFGEYVRFVGRV